MSLGEFTMELKHRSVSGPGTMVRYDWLGSPAFRGPCIQGRLVEKGLGPVLEHLQSGL